MRQVDDSNSIGPFLAFCGVAILLLICTLEVLRPNKLSIPIQIKNNKALCFFSKTCLKVDASNGVLITEGLKVNLRIINFHNLFDLKKDLERVSFYLLKKGNNNVDKNSVQIRPVIKYRGYTNSQEIAGSITGYFILPLKIPSDYEIFIRLMMHNLNLLASYPSPAGLGWAKFYLSYISGWLPSVISIPK